MPGVEDHSLASFPEESPEMSRLVRVDVADGANSTCALMLGILKFPVVEATLAKVVVAVLFRISKLAKALVPIIVPESVWLLDPLIVVVPELWVNVPEFE